MHNYILPKDYLSASSIAMLLRCPRQFEFRYIHNIVNPPTAALLTGTAMHSTLEMYYGTIIASRESGEEDSRMTTDEVVDYTEEALINAVEDAREKSGVKFEDKDWDEALTNLGNISRAYINNVGKHIVPVAVEEEVIYESACGVPIKGYIDLRRELPKDLGLDDEFGICDYKITSKKWNIGQLRNSLQFNLYSMMTGISNIEIHNMVKTGVVYKQLPKKAPVDGVTDISNNLRTLNHTFDGSSAQHMEDLVESCAKLITSGIFTPCNPEEWCCSAEWCGYWGLCRGAGSISKLYVDFKLDQENACA